MTATATTTTNNGHTASFWADNGVYEGTVTDQVMGEKSVGGQAMPCLKLYVKLKSKLNNGRIRSDGVTDLAPYLQVTKVTSLTFDPRDAKKFKRVLDELRSYGFSGDLRDLDPAHPRGFNLKGKTVSLRCWLKDDDKAPSGKADIWFLHDPSGRPADSMSPASFANWLESYGDAIDSALNADQPPPY